MLAINKISTKSIKYDTKLCTYDTTYDTKTINGNDNLCYSFTYFPKNKDIFVQIYKLRTLSIIFLKKP